MLEVGPAYSDSFSKTNVCDDMQTELMWRWTLLEKDSEPSTLCGRGACHTIGTEFIMLHCAVMSFWRWRVVALELETLLGTSPSRTTAIRCHTQRFNKPPTRRFEVQVLET